MISTGRMHVPRDGFPTMRIIRLALIALLPAMCSAVDGPTSVGMVGYWPFDEGLGNRAANALRTSADIFGSTGSARVLSPAWRPGKHGQAMDFSSGQTAVTVEKTTELDCDTQVSIAAWIKLGEAEGRGMIVNHGYAYRLAVRQGKQRRMEFQLSLDGKWAGNWLVGKTTLDVGRWYHVAGVYDGKERRIYVDGELDTSKPAHGTVGAGRHFLIGGAVVRRGKKRIFKDGETVAYHVQEAFAGTIDEVRIWNRALSPEDVARTMREDRSQILGQLPKERDLYLYPTRCVAMLGQETPYEFAVFNGAGTPYLGRLSVAVVDGDGKRHGEAVHELNLGPRQTHTIRVPFRPTSPGAYNLVVSSLGRQLLEAPVCMLSPAARQEVGEAALRKVLHVDLTHALGADAFCDDGTSRVVRSGIGTYREAGPRKHSRFVARLPLRRPGLHLVRVTYPDDKPRTCEIASWSPVEADRYNAHTGYFTGDDFPLSGRMRTFEFVMWARHADQALVFTSWLDGQPAAAATIDVFEVEGRLPARPASQTPSRRLIGHYWEDAQPLSRCFGGNAPELLDFDRVARNLCDYFDYTGQNLLMHPVVWYEGPIYNSLVGARGGKGGFHLPTAGWVDILLKRFEERDFKFYGLFNVHQLPSLMREMNADNAKIRAGEPTFNTVSKENEAAIKTWHHRTSMFNGLHPKVQERVLTLVQELADRYGASPAFAGLGFHLTLAQLLQPGSLDVSYDDWTVGEFQKDTALTVPVAPRDPERFAKRHAWLMANAKEEWIRWRCGRVTDYYGRIAAVLRAKRPDLQFVVTLLEPPMSIVDPQRLAWQEGKTLVEQAREAGIDPLLLAKCPGLVIQQRLGPTAKKKRLTFGTTRGRYGCPPPTPENIAAIRGMDLNAEQQRAFRTTRDSGVFLYNRYFESNVGGRQPLESDWFHGIAWRASAVVPAHEHFMEYYAQAMAMFDPALLAIGGFTNGTVGHERRVERFAQVFRQLPRGKWQELPGLGHDLVGRTIRTDGKFFLYVVNTSAQQQRAVLKTPAKMAPIAGSSPLTQTPEGQAATLAPYQLAAWVGE